MIVSTHIQKIFFTAALALGCNYHALAYNGVWRTAAADNVTTAGTRYLQPDKFAVYSMNLNGLKPELASLPEDPAQAHIIDLPMPGGTFRSFKIWQTPMMPSELAARYPEIKTFTAVATDDSRATAKLDFTVHGFHAMVYDGDNTYFIDPYSNTNDGYYLCYYKRDYTKRSADFVPCGVADTRENELAKGMTIVGGNGNPQLNVINGTLKRTYRLALACTPDYASAVAGANPTKSAVLGAMTTTMNRVNGVYEKDLSVTMQFVTNEDQIIYVTTPSPYASGSMSENQANVTSVIGANNYDIGHLFKKSNGGISDLGCVCIDSRKARSVTGQSKPVGDPFDLDYVAHEIGHEFGAEHTFNASTGSCAGNGVTSRAYEPGSGTTLMAYAGICKDASTGIDNNIQAHSSAYFHAGSLEQLTDFITTTGAVCATTTPTGNIPVVVPSFGADYDVPKQTPFELTAPDAVDADHDALTYCWEEWDLGDFTKDFNATTLGPIFRSFDPTTSTTRIFPTLDKLLHNVNSYLGEKLPVVSRDMIFKLTVRDVLNGLGVVNFPDDEVTLHVTDAAGPFLVQSPNAAIDYWQVGSTVEVKWDVANTTAAPVNCSNVDIMLSLDGGRTYTQTLATSTPNDGTEMITVPNAPTASARVKVKGSGNVFFDISNADFIINSWPAGIKNIAAANSIKVYPIPATDVLHVDIATGSTYQMQVLNALGQTVWTGNASARNEINIAGWPAGMYQLQLADVQTNEKITKKFVVQ